MGGERVTESHEPMQGRFGPQVSLDDLEPKIRRAVLDLTKFCAIVWHDRRGELRICDQPAAVVTIQNGLPAGLCTKHRRAYEWGAA